MAVQVGTGRRDWLCGKCGRGQGRRVQMLSKTFRTRPRTMTGGVESLDTLVLQAPGLQAPWSRQGRRAAAEGRSRY